jgi:hypothetical protein
MALWRQQPLFVMPDEPHAGCCYACPGNRSKVILQASRRQAEADDPLRAIGSSCRMRAHASIQGACTRNTPWLRLRHAYTS